MPRDIDRCYFLEAKVPNEIWVNERSNKSAARRVDVNRAVNFLLHEQVINGLNIFILAGVGRSENCAYTAKSIR